MPNNTYTLAQIVNGYPAAIKGIPCNMTKQQAETLASKAMANCENSTFFALNTKAQ